MLLPYLSSLKNVLVLKERKNSKFAQRFFYLLTLMLVYALFVYIAMDMCFVTNCPIIIFSMI